MGMSDATDDDVRLVKSVKNGVTLDIRLVSGYPACFSGIRLSGRIVGNIRANNRIITYKELITRLAKHTSENKIIINKLHTFTTS